MPSNTDTLSTLSRQEFCVALKLARERKGVTLAEVADRTKIAAELFATLERNDLRRWPKGIFRRSFFRDYVAMIGVPVAEACAEFARLFPEDDGEVVSKPEPGTVVESRDQRGRDHASVFSRVGTAVIDAISHACRSVAQPRVRVRIKVPK